MQASTFIVVFASVVALGSAIQQEIIFYTESNFEGDFIGFQNSKNDFANYSIITKNAKSCCVIGHWYAFAEPDFKGQPATYGNTSETLHCFESSTINSYNSLRHFGARNTSTPAISLYEGDDSMYGGQEYFVQNVAAAPIPFSPKAYASTGKSSWTTYSGVNFDGNSTCLTAGSTNLKKDQIDFTVRSIIRGCGFEAEQNVKKFRSDIQAQQ